MEDIYLIYKNSLQADGYVEVIGSYLGYNVAKIQKIYIDNRINISKLNPIVIRKELALVWRFADTYDGKITVKLRAEEYVVPVDGSLRTTVGAVKSLEVRLKVTIPELL